jgi:hypothetical protein
VISLRGPLHLLTLYEPFAHHLINRGFDKGCADRIPLAIAFTKGGEELLVVANVGIKLCDATLKFCGSREAATLHVEGKEQQSQTL